MDSAYLWIKALHIIAVIAFMAGMLYLPRLFVYHASAGPCSEQSETFKVMERRLDMAIMRPAFVILVLSGATLVWKGAWLSAGWFWAKLVFVAILTGEYAFLIATRAAFARDQNSRSPRFYKIVNEIGTLALIAIVILVVVKPF
jgi:protoporphyrinogen IX oxidase